MVWVAGCARPEPTLDERLGQLARPVIRREFDRPPAGSLVFGRTTYANVVERYGQGPSDDMTVPPLELLHYVYIPPARRAAVPVAAGVMPSRDLELFFVSRVLVGYQFRSTIKDEATDFDESRREQIEKGATTSSQAVALLGEPSGRYAYPLIADRDAIGLRYDYGHVRFVTGEANPFVSPSPRVSGIAAQFVGIHVYRKSLLILVGPDDIVRDLQFESSGRR